MKLSKVKVHSKKTKFSTDFCKIFAVIYLNCMPEYSKLDMQDTTIT